MFVQDIHSHTRYSRCGRDEPVQIVEAAIAGGITQFGICDHNSGIGDRKPEYLKEMRELSKEYGDKLQILVGIEIATINGKCIKDDEDISAFDYCLVEHLDDPGSCVGMDIVKFQERCGIKTGIAHTDLFAFMEREGMDPLSFLSALAEKGIFWEMNVSYDSIHHYREHAYVKKFMADSVQQEIVKKSGIEICVGFDGHRVEDYLPERVIQMNQFLQDNGIRMPFMM